MAKLRLAGVVAIALLVSGLAASAQAHEFVASTTGALKAERGKELIKLGSAKISCTELLVKGTVKSTKETEQGLALTPTKCEGFGATVTLSESEFEFESEEAAAEPGAEVVITDASAKCSVKIESIGKESTLKYANTGKGIKTTVAASGAVWESSGGACGEADEGFENGLIEAEGTVGLEKEGLLEWK